VWADIDTKKDFLNYAEAAAVVSDVIEDDRMLPTSIGVFGTWGTGKSTLLNILELELQSRPSTQTAIIVRFDAWLYQGYDDAKAALMDVIASKLISETDKEENRTLWKRAIGLAKRVKLLRLAAIGAEIAAAAHGVPLFGAVRGGATAIEHLAGGSNAEGDLTEIKAGAKEVRETTRGLLEDKPDRTPPQEIDDFRSEFGKLLEDIGRTLVVFVDNLDRCMPEQTIRTLEAMRLFLFMNKTAFVVAADQEMVRQSVKAFFADIGERHISDYLDKLIQIPVQVPRLGVREVRAYLFQLLADSAKVPDAEMAALGTLLTENLQSAWKDDPTTVEEALRTTGQTETSPLAEVFITADRIAPLLSMAPVNGNPRLIKRMLNVVRMRSRLATRRHMPVSEDLIAKIAVFERCMDDDASKHFYGMVQQAKDGISTDLKVLEDLAEAATSSTEAQAKFRERLPELWKKNADLLESWFVLKPKVSGDLRPIAYLGRDSAALTISRYSLSSAAKAALKLLLEAKSQSVTAPALALKSVSGTEMPLIMEEIANELRQETDWKAQPSAWNGALILVEHAPETAPALTRAIIERTKDRFPPWLATYKGKPWLPVQAKT
jgi:predicted KAP-like P-loop ATPase